ncbi:GNAT family N-acetyltransferase [Clostridium cellulovorans]|uniref:GCN5-related N-acetyltransferase n=1 Tax=Clostridium cellulovorans (strain ATCC 35296 / DSM 3052 / OCM 3 / 743B) TaxID=573061 RepID=D9SUI3_CLOC7|nr:GNAT family protein [Clostridium cellulovorans]ADL52938.1 GCN5-related N-acetyltransferase [Clostridium cellulovorans 743B]
MRIDTRNFLELKGDLVYLKKLDPEYADEYWSNFDDCSIEAMIFTGTQQIFSKSDITTYLEDICSDRSRIDFLIFSKESNKAVGEVVINDIYRNNRSANMRIIIYRKEEFNKGYGSESIILALNYGFGMLNLHRIELEAFVFNERAIHVYEKIGFKKEGIKRDGWFYNHKYYDMITMSILEDEFREKYIHSQVSLDEFNN